MASLNYVTFNQDQTLLAVATSRGLRIYHTDPFERSNHKCEGDISLVEPLFSSSLTAMTLTPRLLRIVNTKRRLTICELTFHGMVVAVKMNRKRLVVMLEEVVFVYDISNMKMLHTLLTPLNPSGIVALSPNSEHNYLAVPHHQKGLSHPQPSHVPKSLAKEPISGDVLLYDLNTMEQPAEIRAHQTPVSCIAISSDGTLMATASEKGTIIRVFAIPEGRKMYQFRRGSMPARIFSMSFNAASTLLCVSSATETVHVFKLAPPNSTPASSQTKRNSIHAAATPPVTPRNNSYSRDDYGSNQQTSDDANGGSDARGEDGATTSANVRQPRTPGIMSLMRRTSQNVSTTIVSRAAGYLPSSVTEMWEPQRDFAWMRVPRGTNGQPVKCVVAMAPNAPQVMIATNEGDFYVYNIDLEKGGEGTLIKRFDDIHGMKHHSASDLDE